MHHTSALAGHWLVGHRAIVIVGSTMAAMVADRRRYGRASTDTGMGHLRTAVVS